MTREEALSKAINIIVYFEAHFAKSKEAREEVENIIEALEQEPCEDWYDVPSNEMTLEQARQAVTDLRKKLAEHLEQGPVLDKIRAEIIEDIEKYNDIYDDTCHGLRMALDIIDRYKAESEDKE